MPGRQIITDKSMRELKSHGTPEFPFEYYLDDTRQFDNNFIEWHWHNEFEWMYVESGSVDCLVGLERFTLGEGDGLFINSKIIHRFESESGAVLPNILFAPEFIAPAESAIYAEYVKPALLCAVQFYILHKAAPEHQAVLNALYTAVQLAADNTPAKTYYTPVADVATGVTNKLEIQATTLRLWDSFFKLAGDSFNITADAKDTLLHTRIRTMLQFISGHYREKISLTDIAASANISKSEALRCFHTAIDSTPVSYLNDYRLGRAKELILSTDDSITNIAFDTGIENTSYFVRSFKKKYGMTPQSLRKAARHVCTTPTSPSPCSYT